MSFMSQVPPNAVKEIRRMAEGTVVQLAGDVDMHRAPALHAALVELAGAQPKRLVLDLTEVSYIDSSGVGTLVEVYRRVNAYKGTMALVGLNARVRGVFEITRLDKFFTIGATVQEILGT